MKIDVTGKSAQERRAVAEKTHGRITQDERGGYFVLVDDTELMRTETEGGW